MRVLTIYYRPQRGGLMKRLRRMIAALLEDGHEVETLSAVPLELTRHPRLDEALVGGRSATHTAGLGFWLRFTATAALALVRALRTRRPDVVVVFDPYYAWIAAPACRLFGVPLVLFVRALPWLARPLTGLPPWLRRITDRIDRIGLRLADRVVVMTESMRRELVARVPSVATDTAVLPNSVEIVTDLERASLRHDLLEKRGWATDACVVVTSGVLTPRKNLEVLVDAVAGASEGRVHLLIVGDGAGRQRLQEHIDALDAGARIALIGWHERPADVVGPCDLFVLPSSHEGMSNSLLEALGLGLPVLVAETPENRESFPTDVLRFSAEDVEELRERVVAFASDPNRRAAITEASRAAARALAFDWDAAVVARIRESLPHEGSRRRPGSPSVVHPPDAH